METRVNVLSFARKLKIRLKEIRKKREADLKKYERDLVMWKQALAAWVKENTQTKISRITVGELRHFKTERWAKPHTPFDVNKFFAGAPKPPAYPEDTQIRHILSCLRQLSITEQKTLTVSQSDIDKYFGEGKD